MHSIVFNQEGINESIPSAMEFHSLLKTALAPLRFMLIIQQKAIFISHLNLNSIYCLVYLIYIVYSPAYNCPFTGVIFHSQT